MLECPAVPFLQKDRRTALSLAREVERFAGHVRTIPVDKNAAPHPEIQKLLSGFKRINAHMAARNAKGEVTVGRKMRVGREFERIGAALRERPQPRTRSRKA